jgi:hypothetical protein
MTLKAYLLLFLLSLTVLSIATIFQPVPGFMDAEYYYAGGILLADGKGFTEPYLWNYLDNPVGIPHASHAYWMPLASLLAALGMILTGSLHFSAARIGFLLLAAFVSPLTATLNYRLTAKKNWAMLSGLLAIFSGFYLARLTTTDTFGLVMVLGAVYLLSIPGSTRKSSFIRWFFLGVITGVFHLSRADGILWIPVSMLIAFLDVKGTIAERLKNSGCVVAGYLLVMGPWILRNWVTFGSLLSPGGLRTLWLTEYDQLFAYPAAQLTFKHWWASGFSQILQARFWALGINLQRILAEQGMIILTPLILLGLWHLRKDLRVVAGLWGWLLTFVMMTFIFPFAGARGGLFHSCAALQPLFWAVTPVGLDICLEWGARKRNWDPPKAGSVFGFALVAVTAFFTVVVFFQNVIGPDPSRPLWTQSQWKYAKIESELQKLGASSDDVVMVKNAPGYYLVSNRPGVAIPYGDEKTLVEAATRYGVSYILLEADHPEGLQSLYENPEKHPFELDYLLSIDGTLIFELKR